MHFGFLKKHADDKGFTPEMEEGALYIDESQLPGAGKGVFTCITIYKDEVVALFKGEVLSDLQAARRAAKGKDRYFISMLDGSILDSMKTSCFAKYANDAAGFAGSAFSNNSKITLDEQGRVCLMATRRIRPFEEIFCNYGKRYKNKHFAVAVK